MQAAALRPFVTVGVSLVAATMVAVAPVQPAPARPLPVVSQAVQLTAAPKPLEFYAQVTLEALINTVTSIGSYPAVAPLFIDELLAHPGQVLESAIGNSARLLFHAAQSLISPFANTLGATLAALRDVAVAAVNLDPADLFNAVVDIPARIADGFLNGGYPLFGSLEAGLLSPPVIDFYYVGVGGPLSFPPFAALYILLNRPAASSVIEDPTNELSTPETSTSTPDEAAAEADPMLTTSRVETDAVPEGVDHAPTAVAVIEADEGQQSVGPEDVPASVIVTDQTRPQPAQRAVIKRERVHRRIAARQEARAERRLAHAASAKRQTPRTAEPTAP